MMPMSKKTFMAAVIFFLIVSVAVTSLFGLVQANPIMIVSGVPRISLLSPQTTLYKENAVTLSFRGNKVDWGTVEYSKIKYWLDGELKGSLSTVLNATETYSLNLIGLEDGQHVVEVTAIVTVKSLTIYYGGITADVLWAPSIETSSGKLNFTVDINPPNVMLISPQNRTYETVNVPLNFTVSESISEIAYSLDGNSIVTFTNVGMARIYGKDNYFFVLNGLEEGSHDLKIYAKDAAGYTGESDIYCFTVDTQPTPTPIVSTNPSPSQQPTLKPSQAPALTEVIIVDCPRLTGYYIIFGIVAFIIIIVTGTVYLKKRKSKKTILLDRF